MNGEFSDESPKHLSIFILFDSPFPSAIEYMIFFELLNRDVIGVYAYVQGSGVPVDFIIKKSNIDA